MQSATILTIGHSNHSIEKLVDLLEASGVEVVVDTRSQPYSKYTTQFNREALQSAIAGAGMKYLYLGRELGGRPEGAEFYDGEGRVLYSKVAESRLFRQGIERVLAGSERNCVALLCAEEDPRDCHRRLLVARVLAQSGGAFISHIRGDGRLQPEDELRAELEAEHPERAQLALFDPPEMDEWKSTRSVLQKKTPESSSAV
jgi:uncharacterized protein (DUF488 family)